DGSGGSSRRRRRVLPCRTGRGRASGRLAHRAGGGGGRGSRSRDAPAAPAAAGRNSPWRPWRGRGAWRTHGTPPPHPPLTGGGMLMVSGAPSPLEGLEGEGRVGGVPEGLRHGAKSGKAASRSLMWRGSNGQEIAKAGSFQRTPRARSGAYSDPIW